jgi:DNA-binding Lrp family transcriptional regulator
VYRVYRLNGVQNHGPIRAHAHGSCMNTGIFVQMKLDRSDLRLLDALQQDATLTNQELGERAGLSASQSSRRKAVLEEAGVIRGYRAELDAASLGLRLLAFVQVRLAAHSGENAAKFRELVLSRGEIQEAYALTGKTDYMLKVVLADLACLSAFVNDVLLRHESISRVRSSIVMDRLKATASLPLPDIGGVSLWPTPIAPGSGGRLAPQPSSVAPARAFRRRVETS